MRAMMAVSAETLNSDYPIASLHKQSIDELEIDQRKIEIRNLKHDLDARARLAQDIPRLIAVWLVVLLLILVAQGNPKSGFYLHHSTINVLLGSTTAGVLGLYAIVAKHFFYKRDGERFDSRAPPNL